MYFIHSVYVKTNNHCYELIDIDMRAVNDILLYLTSISSLLAALTQL